MIQNRKAGYYWVNYKNSWMIAEWCDYMKDWTLFQYGRGGFNDSDFIEIDETQIVR